MINDLWNIGADHAYAPEMGPLSLGEMFGPLGPLMASGGGVVVAGVATLILARMADHLFSPSLQRRFGPRRR